MFSRDNAEQIRDSLPLNFFNLNSNKEGKTPLFQSYLQYYGLNFTGDDGGSKHCAGIVSSGEFKIVCHYFVVPLERQKGTAFLLHGYFDHTGLYGHMIRHCLQLGYTVVIFDLPGHGLSSGPIAEIDSFRQYSGAFLRVLRQAKGFKVNQPWIVIGQSTGAAIIMDALQDTNFVDQFPVQCYILLGPFLRPKRWITSKLLFMLTRWFIRSARRKFAKNSHDEEFLNFLRTRDALQSKELPRSWVLAMIEYQRRFARAKKCDEALHIIQGTGDETVDWRYNLPHIQEKFPKSKIYMIPDARHQSVNESPEFRDQIFSSIDQIIEGAG